MHSLRKAGAALAVLALALIAASSAFAQSSTLYPALDSVSLSSTPITIEIPTFGKVTCTFNGGAFSIPSKGNSSGPVTTNFTTRPTYTGCNKEVTVETSGTWTLSTQYGSAGVAINVPIQGFIMKVNGTNVESTPSGLVIPGGWNNGFTSPTSVSSAMQSGGTVSMWANLYSAYKPATFEPVLQTLTDTTHPASLPVLGP